MKLVIVESPAKARTISRYLGSDYEVAASVGHVRDLPPKELGVDVENGFTPKYVTIRGPSAHLREISVSFVFLVVPSGCPRPPENCEVGSMEYIRWSCLPLSC